MMGPQTIAEQLRKLADALDELPDDLRVQTLFFPSLQEGKKINTTWLREEAEYIEAKLDLYKSIVRMIAEDNNEQ